MNRLKRPVMWAALVAIILLAGFSIYGAFIGADRAQGFFNSIPLAIYWGIFAILLIVGFVLFRRLLKVPSLLLIHHGCILILAGGMWGSETGQGLQKRLFGADTIVKGQMPILEGTQENRIQVADSNETPELPFYVRLKDFRMEYYEPGTLLIYDQSGQSWKLPAEAGNTLALSGNLGKVTVQKVFKNFKMSLQGDEQVAFDAPGGSNPALEVHVEKPDGMGPPRYIFADFPGHPRPGDPLTMSYQRMVSDYISKLEVVKDDKIVATKDIEVNHPLHYEGYHFYQHSYGQNEFGDYTVLMVVSDSGLNLVYAGYGMLIAGVFWHFLGRRLLTAAKNHQGTPGEAARQPSDKQSQPQ